MRSILQTLPVPHADNLAIRLATLADVAWIDSMQKMSSKALGFMPLAQIEGKVKRGQVLVATAGDGPSAVRSDADARSNLCPVTVEPALAKPAPVAQRLGYIIGQDQYFKRDDVGIIYAINVAPEGRRRCVAASLVRALIEGCAWGCRLMSCWVAQDLEANKFWEAMGFVPVAFRTGSAKKSRMHLFWQRRIRQGDTSTPYWFPSQTSGGAIREDRLVLPIPPGVAWNDAMPQVLPETAAAAASPGRLDAKASRISPVGRTGLGTTRAPEGKRGFAVPQGLRFDTPVRVIEKKEKPKPQKKKNDPKLIAAAREIRDRWLEQQAKIVALPSARYEVGNALTDTNRSRIPVEARVAGTLPLLVA